MNTETMRWVDSRLGRPLCWALTVRRRIADRNAIAASDGAAPPERILIVKLVEQGATVVAYSALQRAIDLVGADSVYIMVFAENRFIVDQLALIPPDNVIAIETTGAFRFLRDLALAVRRVRSLDIDAAVDFEFFARSSAILTYLSGARSRVGFHAHANEASYRGDLMTHRLVYNPRLHASESFLALIEALTLAPETLPVLDVDKQRTEPPPHFTPQPDETRRVEELVRSSLPAGSHRLVLLNANASDLVALRKWPPERYVALATRLIEAHADVAIAFTGSGEEAAHAEHLARDVGHERCISLGGRTTMRELLVLYSIADVLVTNDSGPAHYAALAPIEVFTLFGPENPNMFASLSPNSHVLYAALPCSPCVNAFNDRTSPCKDNVCMQKITVDEVFAQVHQLLEATA